MELQHNEINLILKKYNKGKSYPMSLDVFIEHAQRYIQAIKEHRMICSIDKVSKSGMSRTIKFLEIKKNDTSDQHSLLNFYQLNQF